MCVASARLRAIGCVHNLVLHTEEVRQVAMTWLRLHFDDRPVIVIVIVIIILELAGERAEVRLRQRHAREVSGGDALGEGSGRLQQLMPRPKIG